MEDSLAIGLEGGPGIRDAEEILERAREDEREAFEARARYRTDGLPTIEPDGQIAEHLRAGETVFVERPSSVVSRHQRGDGTDDFAGSLYLTSQRLILVGHTPFEVELDQIDELALAGERLLVTLARRDGPVDRCRPAAPAPCPDRGGADRRSLTPRKTAGGRRGRRRRSSPSSVSDARGSGARPRPGFASRACAGCC